MTVTQTSKPTVNGSEPPCQPETAPADPLVESEAVEGTRRSGAGRVVGAPRRHLFTVVAREVRHARSTSARRIASIYGRSGEFYPYYVLAMAKAGRLASRRAALNVVATRCALICICCYYAQLWAWSHEHSVFTGVGLLGAGGCGGYALRTAARTLPRRHFEEIGAVLGYGLAFVLLPAYLWTFTSLASLFPKHGSRDSRLLPQIALGGDSNWNLTDLVTLSVWCSVMIAGAWLLVATTKLPARHSPLDETFFAALEAMHAVGNCLSARRWADHRRARLVIGALERTAALAERAFLDRAGNGPSGDRAYAVGQQLAERFRAHKPTIAFATSRKAYESVFQALLADVRTWIADEPFEFPDQAPEAARPPRFRRLRKVLPTVMRTAVLGAAGYVLPLLPGVAISGSAVESVRTILWTAAVLSLTVGGINPADQVMSLLHGNSGAK